MSAARTRIEQYGISIHYVTSRRQRREVYERLGVEADEVQASGLTEVFRHHDTGLISDVVISLDPKHPMNGTPAAVVDTLAHEAWHAVSAVLDDINEPREKWHEQTAYLIGWLTSWLWRKTPKAVRS